jgi:hypothetical protein
MDRLMNCLCLGVVLASVLLITLLLLKVVLARERVKVDLQKRQFHPIIVRWRPLQTFIFWKKSCRGSTFDVVYVDQTGSFHQARCLIFYSTSKIEWLADELIPTEPCA